MTTKADLERALHDAMRSRDELRKRTIRMVLTAIQLAEVDRKGDPLDENGVMSILQKEVKSRRESIADAERANRPAIAESSQAEIGVLETFLPKQLTPTELDALAREAIAESGASSPADMGKAMKLLTPRLQGRASGAQASQAVRRLLQG